MEINITKLFNAIMGMEDDSRNYQDSVMNSGKSDIGEITWKNAVESPYEYVTDENKSDIQDHFLQYGAWSEEEIAGWSDEHLDSILIQDIVNSIQEIESSWIAWDWDKYEKETENGQTDGRLSKGADDEVWFCLND